MIAEVVGPLPDLESLGLRLVDKVEFEDGQQTAIFKAENGKVFLCPAVWGLPDERPLIPLRKKAEVIASARAFLEREGLLSEDHNDAP